jgi:hypothetical protein
MEESTLDNLELAFLASTVVGLALGCLSIAWARTSEKPVFVLLGRCLFVATLLFLGGSGVLAALNHAEGVVPLGLTSGFLTMGMLWEIPHAAWRG